MRFIAHICACFFLLSSSVSAHNLPPFVLVAVQSSTLNQVKELIREGRFSEARQLLEPLVQVQDGGGSGGAGEVHSLMGIVLIKLGDYPAAIMHLQKAAELLPASFETKKLLAKAYLLSGNKNNAASVLETITRSPQADAESWSLLGKIYQEQNRFPQALRSLEASIRLKSDDLSTLYALAYTQFGLGDYEKAKDTFKRVVALNDRTAVPSAGPHASFAMVLLRLNLIKEAEEEVRRALAINARDELTVAARKALEARLGSQPTQVGVVPLSTQKMQPTPAFKNISVTAGLNIRLENTPTPAKHQIETMPGGVAVLDYNNDGLMDIYFTNGAESPSLQKTSPRFWNRLFRNNGNMTFTDVTAVAGVEGTGYMMGAAAADYDNDGFTDLFVTGVDRNILYHNNGNGTFSNVTRQAGLDFTHPIYGHMWAVHATWLDYDNDGLLDLLVINYCRWDSRDEPVCVVDSKDGQQQRTYCHPGRYAPLPNQLFHNKGDGTFTDVSIESGIGGYLGKGMGAAIADFNGDGLIDIFIANDTEPNYLFQNQGMGKFAEVGVQQGVAFNQFGASVSSMGVDFRDLDNDGRPDLFVTALSNEGFLLFRNAGERFDDVSDQWGISLPSLALSGWSNMIVDLNNDGWKDLFSANGHALDNVELTQSRTYRQHNSIFQNLNGRMFLDTSREAGTDFQRVAAHRGAAVADFNNDGLMDVVTTALGERPELFENVTIGAGHWLLVRLVGRKSNRDGIGAVLRLETSDGRTLWNHVSTSVGYASSGEARVHFGLGSSPSIKSLEITWPGGKRQKVENLKSDCILTIKEAE